MCLVNKEELILQNIPLVKHIASKYYTGKIGMDYEDLVSYGVMGLIDASNKFDANRGAKFSTYASLRIKSYIIDEIRRASPISRGDIAKMNEYNRAVEKLQNILFREPSEEEVAKELNLSLKEVNHIEGKIYLLSTTSLDTVIFEEDSDIRLMDTIKASDSLSPSNIIENEEKLEILSKAIDKLKERDRLILSLYYYEEMSLKEIGLTLGISESRVSQIHSRAIINLRNTINKLDYIA
ncbi:FliA/WhiG family RNA polymerase sigma factor [Romboutsia weinsteinii]|uniref:FliA/WhiG family RNA polymerase sigma factor n=1 Tax=Romboutsia weinsteinii TaxID=2020949 RepID=A0A371J8D5_9FIRM|nr:FliA/WhiG family RNA polymerase sigma factor [Romboutsia weinsteinii]RDY28938.1 FliA/WhiG family RNA polymerase sigma factor [Romboutsia weinsteinii]